MTDRPWLSVIVPSYNGARYLDQALESVAAQAAPDIEVLVIDDGSADDTRDVVRSFASRLRLTWHGLEHTGNWVRTTNVGLELAQGRFASMLHQDDLWLPGRVSTLRSVTEVVGDSAFVMSASAFVDDLGHRIGKWSCPLAEGPNGRDEVIGTLIVQNFVAIPAPIFPLKLARELGGLDEGLWYVADWDFWLRLAARSETVHYHPDPLSAFRVHAGSQTVARSSAAIEMREQQEIVVARYLSMVESSRQASAKELAAASIAVNTALARAANSEFSGWAEAAAKLARLGPVGLARYLRQSRVLERTRARLRARLLRRGAP